MKVYKDVDSYIKSYPKDVQLVLVKMRALLKKVAPKAEEGISYGMPAYKYLGKPLVYFGGQKAHLGFYPTPSPIEAFKKELTAYKQSKGTVQFPFTKPVPWTLIKKMVKYKMAEIKSKSKVV